MKIDTLIVGQGLAGSLLAWELNKRGQEVMVIDDGACNASSVAAGLVNPVTGLRFVKTGDIDLLLPAAQACYRELENYFRQPFFLSMPMFRIFTSQTELDNGIKKLEQPSYSAYLGRLNAKERRIYGFHCPFGFIEQKQTGRLLTANLLHRLRQWLAEAHHLHETIFDPADLNLNDQVEWQNIQAKQLIFCEGYQSVNNPWFKHLPFTPAKGEILTLHGPDNFPDRIINFGHWCLPDENNKIKLGATFDWQFSDLEPSERGREFLLNSLKMHHADSSQFQLSAHQAGIRPCTEDRQPFIGRHPLYPQLGIFNGFGTKGSLQIPWHCQQFADYLIYQKPLPSACDINRYPASRLSG